MGSEYVCRVVDWKNREEDVEIAGKKGLRRHSLDKEGGEPRGTEQGSEP